MKKYFPWPNGRVIIAPPPADAVLWRNRHLRMGEDKAVTAPPAKPQGPPGAGYATPYSESPPTAVLGGAYADETRAIGMDEPPTAAVLNRPIYDLSCAVDMLAEQAVAVPWLFAGTIAPPSSEISLASFSKKVLYLGRPGTSTHGSPVLGSCSAQIEVRAADGRTPLYDAETGNLLYVQDVTDGSNSLYTSLPDTLDAFPFGTPGTIALISSSGGPISDDQITFATDPPSGTPPPPATTLPVGFFNYSLWERCLRAGMDHEDCFAICVASTAGPPDYYLVNRDLSSAGWAAGDVIYTTRFAYAPTIVMTGDVTAANITVFGGHPWFSAGLTDYHLYGWLGLDRFPVLEPALTMTEPSGASDSYVYDEINALFRATDAPLKGTTGFDFRGYSYDAAGFEQDSYAGFLHRRRLVLNNSYTRFPAGMGVDYDRSTGLLSIPGGTGNYYCDVGGNTCLIPGHDLIELEGEGVFILNKINSDSEVELRRLSGVIGGGVGSTTTKATLYRPQFRTGALLDATGTSLSGYGGNVLCGDALFVGGGILERPAATLITGGSRYLLRGFDFPDDFRGGTPSGEARGEVLKIFDDGSIRFGYRQSYDQSWKLTTELDTAYESNYVAFAAKVLQYSSDGGHAWGASYSPTLRYVTVCEIASPTVLSTASLRIGVRRDPGPPARDYDGLGTSSVSHAALLLGDPHDDFTIPNYAGLRARDPETPPSGLVSVSMFLHRDGETLSGEANGGTQEDDLYARLREVGTPLPYGGGAHPVTGGYHRFELTYDATPGRTVDYGWSDERPFDHHIPPQKGRSVATTVGGVPQMETWYYGSNLYAVAGYTFPPGPGTSEFLFTGNGAFVADFPFSLPQACRLHGVSVKYWRDAWAGGGASTAAAARLMYQDTAMGAGATAASSFVLDSGVFTDAVGWQVLTFGAAPREIDNSQCVYWVRVIGAFDDGAAGAMTTQLVAGIKLSYTMQSFMPA